MTISETQEEGVAVIALQGRLDAMAATQTEARLLAAAERVGRAVVLDLSELEYVSSTGLQAVIRFAKTLAARRCALYLCTPTPFVSEIFEISHLSRFFDIRPTRQDALAASHAGESGR